MAYNKEWHREHYKKNRGAKLKYQQKWSKDNPEHGREWREKNPDRQEGYNITRNVKRSLRKMMFCLYAGGECLYCGLGVAPPLNRFHFHHTDENEKLFGIAGKLLHSNILRTLTEIDKCDLLCEVCHTVEHHKANRRLT